MSDRPTRPDDSLEPETLQDLRHGVATREEQQEGYQLLGGLVEKLNASEQRNRELEVEAACKDTILANNIQGMSNRDVRIVELEAEVAELKGVCDAD